MPVFGMYLPSVHATTKTRKADNTARIIFKVFQNVTKTHDTPLQLMFTLKEREKISSAQLKDVTVGLRASE